MSDKQIIVQGSVPCFILFIVFLVLKLTEVIDWSWVWVCAPLWIPLASVVGLGVVVFAIVAIISGFAFLAFLWQDVLRR